MIKAVIFDFDGVINNFPEVIWKERIKFLEKEYGVKVNKKDLEHLLGLTLDDQVNYLVKRYKISLTKQHFQSHRESIEQIVKKEVVVMPGIKVLLTNLKRNNIQLAIASNKPRASLEKQLQSFGVSSFFQVIITLGDTEKPKPDPGVFLLAAKKLKVDPTSCVVIEDAIHGISGAKKARMYAIGVCSGFHGDFKGADLVVKGTKELTVEKILLLHKK